MTDDSTLLRSYAQDGSEAAFAELARRHLPMVYAAACRRLGGDTHQAEDVTQAVFSALARDAARLSRHAVLTGWLYTATRNAAIDGRRAEQRRRVRETEAQIMQAMTTPAERPPDWAKLRPILDGAMDQLGELDREAVLRRFFQARPFAEIAAQLGLNEDSVRKRVERAMEKLRTQLQRRGLTSTSVAIASLLTDESALAAPPGLAAKVTGAAVTSGGAKAGALFMTFTKLPVGIAAALLTAGAVGLAVQRRTITNLRETQSGLQRELAGITKATAPAPSDAGRVGSKIKQASLAQMADSAGLFPRGADGAVAPRAGMGTVELQQRKVFLHRRYDPFLQKRGLTAAQINRFVELMIQQAEARQDLQAAIEEVGMKGGDPNVEILRTKLYAPVTEELRSLLGQDGYAAYGKYEIMSYYRSTFVEPLIPVFESANATLSAGQADQLAWLIGANDQPHRAKATDIGTESWIDWNATVAQAGTLLSPAQLALLQAYANRQKSAGGSL